jgi:hypothetical protein
MRIFSEDETLVSTSMGSGSIMSQASPHMGNIIRVRQQMVSVTSGLVGVTYKCEVSRVPFSGWISGNAGICYKVYFQSVC